MDKLDKVLKITYIAGILLVIIAIIYKLYLIPNDHAERIIFFASGEVHTLIASYGSGGETRISHGDVLNIDKGTAYRFYDHKVWSENEDSKAYWE